MHTVKFKRLWRGRSEYRVMLDGVEVGRVFRTWTTGWPSDRRMAAWCAIPVPHQDKSEFYEDTRREATEQLIGWLTRRGSV
jgi:hypothetical protein